MKNPNLNDIKNNFLELSQDLMCVCGFDGILKFVNLACQNLSGYTEKELLSKPFIDFIHSDDHHKTKGVIADLSKGKRILGFENRMLCKDGSIKYIQWTSTPKVEENDMYCVGRDITDQKHAEQKIAKEKSVGDNYLKIIGSIILNLNQEGEITLLNKKGHEVLGYQDGELIGKNWFKTCLPKAIGVELKTYFDELIVGKVEGQETNENKVIRKDGQKSIIKWYNTLVKDEHGKIIGILSSGEDVTEQKKAEDSLKKSRLIIDSTTDVVITTDLSGTITSANSAVKELCGYNPEELVGEPVAILWRNEDISVLQKSIRKLIRGQVIPNLEIVLLDKQGNEIPILISLTGIKNQKGKIVELLGINRGIKKLKDTQEKLKSSEHKYKTLIETASDAIYLMSEDGRIIDTNQCACEMLGRSKDEIIGSMIDSIDPNYPLDEFLKFWQNVPFNEQYIFETTHLKKDGTTIPIEISGEKYKVNEEVFYYGIARDISERKQAEEEILQNSANLTALIENTNDFIWSIDKDYKLLTANSEFLDDITPLYNEKLSVGSLLLDKEKLPPELYKEWKDIYDKVLSGNRFKTELETKLRPDKKKFLELFYNPIINDKKEITGVSVFGRDTTDRKHFEYELRASEEKYKQLFVMLMNAFALHEMIFDEKGEPIDYKFLEVNPAWEKIVGINKETVLNKTVREIMPDIEESWVQVYGRVVKTGIPEEFEDYNESTHKYYHIYAYRTEPGKFAVLFNDITASKHAEKDLKESEERFRELVNTINSGVAIYKVLNDGKSGSDYIIQEFNAFSLKHEQLEKQNVIGKSLKDIRPNIDDYGLIETFQKVWKTGKSAFFPAKVYVDEKYSNYYENRVFRLPSGEIVAIYDDVSERENALIEIKESKDRFDLAMNASKDGIFDWDLISNDIYYSPGWKSMLGYKYDEIPNDFSIWETNTEPEDVKRSWAMQQEVITKKRDRFEMEFKMKHKDGHWVDILSRAEAVFDAKGKAVRMVGTHVDISERKKTELELIVAKEKAEESEEKYRLLHENAGLGIGYLSAEGIVMSFNSIASKDMGGVPEDFEGKSIFDLYPKDAADTYLDRIQRAINEDKTEVYEDYVQLPNQGKWFLSTYTKIVDSNKAILGIQIISQDISQLKQSEIELKKSKEKAEESEEKYRRLYESNLMPISIFDSETLEFLSVNNAFVEKYGYTKEEFLKMTILDIRPESEHEILKQAVNLEDKGLENRGVFLHKKKNGEIINVEIIRYDLLFEGRKAKLVFANDISELKRSELELREAKEKAEEITRKLKAALSSMSDAIFISDLKGEFIDFNEAFATFHKFANIQECKKTLKEFPVLLDVFTLDGELVPLEMWVVSRALRGEIGLNKEYVLKRKDTGETWVGTYNYAPVRNNDGDIIGSVVAARDVTERAKLEQTKDILVAISNEILTTNDLEDFFHRIFIELRKIIDTNNFYIALYDEQSDMISTPYIADKLDTSITDFPAKKTMTGHVIKAKKSMLLNQVDFQELVKSGAVDLVGPPSDVWIGVPLFSGEKVIGVLVIQNYEGEKRLSREDLRVLEYVAPQISLAIERKKVVEDLKSALGKAQESDRLKSAFLANMSHEIRTPMNGILGFTELLKEPGLSGKEQQKYISIIESSGDRMLNTIHDIIDISKIEAGQIELSYSTINLNNQLDELFDFFLPEAKKKNIQLSHKKTLTDQNAIIKTDKDKLNSILTNLIKNAIKFTDSGKIEFGYLLDEKAKQPELQFYVKDTGVGISKEKQKVVFDRFVQADNKTTRLYEGSGLGLAISKAYVEMLGGKIWLKSEEGVGTLFSFSHPYSVSKSLLNKTTELNKQAMKKKSLKILITEDEEFSIEFLSVLLHDYSKELLVAKTGIEAVEICKNNPDIDLILMDVRLPEISGYEATKRIREFNKEVFILAQTAFAQAGDREKCIAAGCNDYIPKPIKKEKLFEIISNNF